MLRFHSAYFLLYTPHTATLLVGGWGQIKMPAKLLDNMLTLFCGYDKLQLVNMLSD